MYCSTPVTPVALDALDVELAGVDENKPPKKSQIEERRLMSNTSEYIVFNSLSLGRIILFYKLTSWQAIRVKVYYFSSCDHIVTDCAAYMFYF